VLEWLKQLFERRIFGQRFRIGERFRFC